MNSDYKPKPIETDNVELPADLIEIGEKLAEHIHDLWALERMNQGWTLGENRDDAKKLHPGLIAYDDLEDDEKVYDRNTAMGTLKAIVALGFTIVPADKS